LDSNAVRLSCDMRLCIVHAKHLVVAYLQLYESAGLNELIQLVTASIIHRMDCVFNKLFETRCSFVLQFYENVEPVA